MPAPCQVMFELAAVLVLVPDDRLAGVRVGHVRCGVEHAAQRSRSSASAPVSANRTGKPLSVQTRQRRRRQTFREWDALWTYLAQPAMLERVAVSRQQPQPDRGGVDEPYVVAPQRGDPGEGPVHADEQA